MRGKPRDKRSSELCVLRLEVLNVRSHVWPDVVPLHGNIHTTLVEVNGERKR